MLASMLSVPLNPKSAKGSCPAKGVCPAGGVCPPKGGRLPNQGSTDNPNAVKGSKWPVSWCGRGEGRG